MNTCHSDKQADRMLVQQMMGISGDNDVTDSRQEYEVPKNKAMQGNQKAGAVK